MPLVLNIRKHYCSQHACAARGGDWGRGKLCLGEASDGEQRWRHRGLQWGAPGQLSHLREQNCCQPPLQAWMHLFIYKIHFLSFFMLGAITLFYLLVQPQHQGFSLGLGCTRGLAHSRDKFWQMRTTKEEVTLCNAERLNPCPGSMCSSGSSISELLGCGRASLFVELQVSPDVTTALPPLGLCWHLHEELHRRMEARYQKLCWATPHFVSQIQGEGIEFKKAKRHHVPNITLNYQQFFSAKGGVWWRLGQRPFLAASFHMSCIWGPISFQYLLWNPCYGFSLLVQAVCCTQPVFSAYCRSWRGGMLANSALRAKVQREQVTSLSQKTLTKLNLNEILLGLRMSQATLAEAFLFQLNS